MAWRHSATVLIVVLGLTASLAPVASASWTKAACVNGNTACAYYNSYDESRTLTCDSTGQTEIVGADVDVNTPAGSSSVGGSYSCWNWGWYWDEGAIVWIFVWPLNGNGVAVAGWAYDSKYGPYCGVYLGPSGAAPCGYVSVNADCASQQTPAVEICWRNKPEASVLGFSACYERNYNRYGKLIVLGNSLESPWIGYAGCLVFKDVLG